MSAAFKVFRGIKGFTTANIAVGTPLTSFVKPHRASPSIVKNSYHNIHDHTYIDSRVTTRITYWWCSTMFIVYTCWNHSYSYVAIAMIRITKSQNYSSSFWTHQIRMPLVQNDDPTTSFVGRVRCNKGVGRRRRRRRDRADHRQASQNAQEHYGRKPALPRCDDVWLAGLTSVLETALK